MRRQIWPTLVALTAVLVLGACGRTEGTGSDPTTEPSPTMPSPTEEDPVFTSVPLPEKGGLPTGPVPPEVLEREDVRAAVAAEAARRSVDPTAVSVAGFAEVTWTDGSLGCPEPGVGYTQALVPGYQLVLAVDGELASYHSGGGAFAYCADPQPPVPDA